MTVHVPPHNRPIIVFYSPTLAIVEGWCDFSLPSFEPEGGWSSQPHRHETNHAHRVYAGQLADLLSQPPESEKE